MLAAALPAGHAGAEQPGRAPRQHAPLAPPRRAAAAVHALAGGAARGVRARAARRRGRPARGDRRVERHRRDLAARRARGDRAPPWRGAVRRRRPARAASPDRHGGRAASTISRSPGHKLYAPFGAGALVAGAARLRDGAPLLQGGGAVKLVDARRRRLGGRPRAPRGGFAERRRRRGARGGVPPAARVGMETIAAHERALARRLWDGAGRTCPACARCGCGRRGRARRPGDVHARGPPASRCSRRSSAPSTRSASATAASARIR